MTTFPNPDFPGPAVQEESVSDSLPRSPLVFLLFLLVACLLYYRSFGCFFVWDEYHLIIDNAAQGAFDWQNLPSLFVQSYFPFPEDPDLPGGFPYYRPLPVLLHGLTYQAAGLFFPAYHLESLLLHATNALLVYLLFLLLLRQARSRGYPAVALATALLFLVHPRNVETVCIIANQTGLLCTCFALLSLYCWSQFLAGSSHPVRLYLTSLATLLAATLCKESAYVLPVLHVVLYLLFGRTRSLRDLPALAGLFLMPGIPLFVRLFVVQGESVRSMLSGGLFQQSAVNPSFRSVLVLLLHQLEQWLFPTNIQLFQYSFLPEKFAPALGILALAVLLAAGLVLISEKRPLLFALAWFAVFYLPSSNLVSMGGMSGGGLKTGAHHLYPAQAGLEFLLAGAILLVASPAHGTKIRSLLHNSAYPILGILILLLGCQTFRFSNSYRSADRFYEKVIHKNPVYVGAWQNYGFYRAYYRNDPVGAERILLDGIHTMQSLGYDVGRMKLIRNLLYLQLEEGRSSEADTLLQCVRDSWVEKTRGNLYFWRSVEFRKAKTAGVPTRSPPEEGRR